MNKDSFLLCIQLSSPSRDACGDSGVDRTLGLRCSPLPYCHSTLIFYRSLLNI